MPVHGHDAQIHYNFNLWIKQINLRWMKMVIDFHRLDMIEPVEEGHAFGNVRAC